MIIELSCAAGDERIEIRGQPPALVIACRVAQKALEFSMDGTVHYFLDDDTPEWWGGDEEVLKTDDVNEAVERVLLWVAVEGDEDDIKAAADIINSRITVPVPKGVFDRFIRFLAHALQSPREVE